MAGVKWCPAPGCERAIAYADGGERDIDCSCGARWCFKCREEAHAPAPCEQVAQWNAKNRSDKDNMDWILANTKMCPKCKAAIEKNNGCNHMYVIHCDTSVVDP
jgi:ariadne-1